MQASHQRLLDKQIKKQIQIPLIRIKSLTSQSLMLTWIQFYSSMNNVMLANIRNTEWLASPIHSMGRHLDHKRDFLAVKVAKLEIKQVIKWQKISKICKISKTSVKWAKALNFIFDSQ